MEKLKGKVIWYDKKQNIGVIQEDEGFQYSVCGGALDSLNFLSAGDLVEFEQQSTEKSPGGNLHAINVTLGEIHVNDCGGEDCQQCCTHDDWDHDQCMNCGKERCPGEAIDRAMDYFEDR